MHAELMHLDLLTVKVMTEVTLIIVSVATFVSWKINRPVAGMRLFSLGIFVFCLGSAAIMLRLIIPVRVIIVIADALVVAGMIIAIQGIRNLREFAPLPRLVVIAAVAVVSVTILYWTYVNENYGMRVAVISVALALLAADAAASMIRRVPVEDRLVYWPTGWAFAFAGAFLVVQAGFAFMGSYTRYLAPIPIEVPLTICANIAYVGCGFGMLLVSNTQLRHSAERMAMFDPLTNLPNRRVLLDRLLDAEYRALGKGWQLGVIYLDLDGFKVVNDTMGHQAGDELLRNIGSAMIPVLGPGDCLARVGGDEFVVVVEDVATREDLTSLAERLKAAVENEKVPGHGTNTVRASYGIAIFPADGGSAHDVMREADSAMYDAKRLSRTAGQTAGA